MVPATVKTDIIIAIRPQHVANIVRRVKNHEYRKYLIPHSVERFWIYETSPASAIKYVAIVSRGKQPGEVPEDGGLQNADFNQGKLAYMATYAYEIQRLEALEPAVTMQDLKARDWLGGPPQKYCYVRESMIEAMSDTPRTLVFDSCQNVPIAEPPRENEATQNKEKSKSQESRSSTKDFGTLFCLIQSFFSCTNLRPRYFTSTFQAHQGRKVKTIKEFRDFSHNGC